MTDRDLAARTVEVNQLELAARAHMHATAEISEQDAARAVLRHAVALRRMLEQWIVARAIKAMPVDARVA